MRHAARLLFAATVLTFTLKPAFAVPRLEIRPGTFDFGWAPDNARITAQFTVVNGGEDMVPLTAVKPTCGCTVSDFTPDALPSHEEKKISLTFNTRGYTNQEFHKTANVKTDLEENSYTVFLTGHVLKPDNGLMPDSGGIAGFEKGTERKKKINIANKTQSPLTLTQVQMAAPWAHVKLPSKAIQPGASAPVEISVDGSLEEDRATSVTIAPAESPEQNRVTLAIRTGTPPPSYRPYVPPSTLPPATKPGEKPKTSDKPKK